MSLGSLGASWAVLARLGRILGVHWVRLGASERVLEASWSHLGVSWGDFGRVLGALGGFLGGFFEYLWKIFCNFKQYAKIAKNLGKSIVFFLLLEPQNPPRASKINEKPLIFLGFLLFSHIA